MTRAQFTDIKKKYYKTRQIDISSRRPSEVDHLITKEADNGEEVTTRIFS